MKQGSEKTNKEDLASPPASVRSMSDFVDTYYAGCSMVVSSPVDICVYFGRFTLKDLDTGRPNLVQLFEKQVYLTPDEAERLGQAIIKTVQVFKATQRGELRSAANSVSQEQDAQKTKSQNGLDELIKV